MNRIHMSKTPVKLVAKKYKQNTDLKPRGFWYGIEDEWKTCVEFEMPHWLGEHEYFVDLGDSNVLFLDTPDKIINFHKEYRQPHGMVDWNRLSQTYDGIEISPYQWGLRLELLWYYGWDVASGCIWNLEKVKLKVKNT
jgi:hypothetical protein